MVKIFSSVLLMWAALPLLMKIFWRVTVRRALIVFGTWEATTDLPQQVLPMGPNFIRNILNAAIATARRIGVSPYAVEPQAHQIEGSHATHVASIAAGNRGICRKASIACVMIDLGPEDQDRRRSFYDSVRIAHAVEYLLGVAEELGKERGLDHPVPIAINISLGTNGHAHDGSSAVSRWIDHALVAPGRVVCVAAGNSGQDSPTYPGDLGYIMGRIHSSGRISSRGLTNTLDWIVAGDGIADLSENEMEIWYEAQDRFSVSLTTPEPGSETIDLSCLESLLKTDNSLMAHLFRSIMSSIGLQMELTQFRFILRLG